MREGNPWNGDWHLKVIYDASRLMEQENVDRDHPEAGNEAFLKEKRIVRGQRAGRANVDLLCNSVTLIRMSVRKNKKGILNKQIR